MPEAPEVKWVFMVVVIGALYWSKKETKKTNIWTTGAGSSGSTFSTGPAAYKQKANVPNKRKLKLLIRGSNEESALIASMSDAEKNRFLSLKNQKERDGAMANLGYYTE